MIVARKIGTRVLHLLATQEIDGKPFVDTRRTRCDLGVVRPVWTLYQLTDTKGCSVCPACLAGGKS